MSSSCVLTSLLRHVSAARTNFLTPLETRVARWLFRRLLRQSWSQLRLSETMTELATVARETFYEDNDATIASYLEESLQNGIRKSLPYAHNFK